MSKRKYLVLKSVFAYGDQWQKGSVVELDAEALERAGKERVRLIVDETAAPQGSAVPAAEAKPAKPPVVSEAPVKLEKPADDSADPVDVPVQPQGAGGDDEDLSNL